jgi:hypothetical protein
MWQWLQGLTGGAPAFVGSVTGSGLGLIALVIGALFNAHLNRKRDKELRRMDACAVANAIRAELTGVSHTLRENADRSERTPAAFLTPDITHSIRVGPKLFEKLVFLDADTVLAVVEAYVVIDQFCENCLLLGGSIDESSAPNRRLILIPADSSANAIEMFHHLADLVQHAVGKLGVYKIDPEQG